MEGDVGLSALGRWERLFFDLNAVADGDDWADLAAEARERTRGEIGRLRMTDRLRPAVGHPLEIMLTTGTQVGGVLAEVGPDWFLIAESGARETLVAVAGVASAVGLGARSANPGSEGKVAARLDLRYALRRLVQSREPVIVTLAGGASVSGTLDSVGADYVEIAEHDAGEFRRRAAVRRVHTVPWGSVVMLRPA
jgi:small nuclear ribonucleoprotein (snRNP)-like protein